MDVTAGTAPGTGGRMRRRRNIVLGAVVLAVIASAGGLLLSTTIKSPAQQAAQAAPPAATRLTAPVRRMVITSSVLAQGVVSTPPQVSGPIGGSLPADGSTAGSDAQQIVTRIVQHAGDTVGQGSVILEVDAQPVFVLQGSEPAYRNLMPGETGTDVAQLQADLESLGYSAGGDASGVYGAGTAAAVAAYYQALGFTAPQISTGPKARRGAWVPLAEMLFAPRLPAWVAKLGATVGQKAGGALVTLSVGRPSIRGQLSPADKALVRPGMTVRITSQVSGRSAAGTITSVGSKIESAKSISGGVYVSLGVRPGQRLPAADIGQDVSLSISSGHSAGPVLAVPEAAVFAGADGQTYVSKVTGPRSQARILVRTGLTGDGMVQVTPSGHGTLTPGDQVVTGADYAQQAALAGLPG